MPSGATKTRHRRVQPTACPNRHNNLRFNDSTHDVSILRNTMMTVKNYLYIPILNRELRDGQNLIKRQAICQADSDQTET